MMLDEILTYGKRPPDSSKWRKGLINVATCHGMSIWFLIFSSPLAGKSLFPASPSGRALFFCFHLSWQERIFPFFPLPQRESFFPFFPLPWRERIKVRGMLGSPSRLIQKHPTWIRILVFTLILTFCHQGRSNLEPSIIRIQTSFWLDDFAITFIKNCGLWVLNCEL